MVIDRFHRWLIAAGLLVAVCMVAYGQLWWDPKPAHANVDADAAAAAEYKVVALKESEDIRVVHFTVQWDKADPKMSFEACVRAYRMADEWLAKHPEYEKDGGNPYHFHNNEQLVLFVKRKP
jgi:hypothetical protein